MLGIPTRPALTTKQPTRRPAKNVVVRRLRRVHILGDSASNEHDDADVDTGTDRCGLSGAVGHCIGADRAVPQGA